MHVFVSTKETQGQRENDFCFVPEGEIVIPTILTCTNEKADGHCGCARSMGGIDTHTSTTTMKVIAFDGSRLHLERLIGTSLRDSGWTNIVRSDLASEFAGLFNEEASKFEVGTVVEYRDGEFAVRQA